jgi:N-acetylglutamate synthase/N-acetylornithine aminotransferase
LGAIYSAQGQLKEALTAFLTSFDIRKKLTEDAPSNSNWQCDLSVSYEKIAGVYQQ